MAPSIYYFAAFPPLPLTSDSLKSAEEGSESMGGGAKPSRYLLATSPNSRNYTNECSHRPSPACTQPTDETCRYFAAPATATPREAPLRMELTSRALAASMYPLDLAIPRDRVGRGHNRPVRTGSITTHAGS